MRSRRVRFLQSVENEEIDIATSCCAAAFGKFHCNFYVITRAVYFSVVHLGENQVTLGIRGIFAFVDAFGENSTRC